jgi:hypothetical protein
MSIDDFCMRYWYKHAVWTIYLYMRQAFCKPVTGAELPAELVRE